MSLQVRAAEEGRTNLWVVFDEDWLFVRNERDSGRLGIAVRDPTLQSPDEFDREKDEGVSVPTHWVEEELVDEIAVVVRGGR